MSADNKCIRYTTMEASKFIKSLISFSNLSSIIVPLLCPYSLIFQFFNKGLRVGCIYILATKVTFENKVFRSICCATSTSDLAQRAVSMRKKLCEFELLMPV